ncbi:LLM class flavin-dependent oxidoreductase [Roseomonas sp. BN140053]|uniref:LLM class flavin-dependent oxidoreductase n=1 Tax=Roseomonas sp. BN140053 TaxID=3391898 RepID=UPI0039EAAA4C
MAPRLSILDQSPVSEGRNAADAIGETLALARLADELGFHRYWLAEHHNTEALAGPAPEILISAVAATTRRIRVGSAGVMLPHYSALKVAEQFRVLEGIAPGRIDLGVGRAPGSDGRTAFALNPEAAQAADRFPEQLRDLLGWLGDSLPEGHRFAAVRAQPAVPTRPEVWVLGSSDYGAQVAAYFGLPYCFAHFITEGRGAAEALALYRDGFRPGLIPAPHASACVFALAADTEAEAWRLFRSRELARVLRDSGRFVPLPSVETAERYPYNAAEQAQVERRRARAIVGTGAQVRDQLHALAAELGVQELAVLTACHDAAARRRSYTLLAEAAGLTANLTDHSAAA